MLNDSAVSVEIGYIYTFVITSVLLTSMTIMTSEMVMDSSRASLKLMMEDIAFQVERELGHVSTQALRNPNSTIDRTIPLQPVAFTFRFRIEATTDMLYMNASFEDIKLKRPILNPGRLQISGSVSGSAREMRILYSVVNGTGVIEIMSA